MRVFLTAISGFLLAACGTAPEASPTRDLGRVDLVANAPEGPLALSSYPTHYELDLTLDPRESRFGGTVTITLRLSERSSGLYLHGRGLDVTRIQSRVGDAAPVNGTWTEVLESGVAWVDFGQAVAPGLMVLEIDYNTAFDANLSGLFKVTEQGDAYALAKSESIQARRFMPGFDQPAFKAPFDITLTIPETDSAISNAPEASVTPLGNGLKRVAFETTRPLPTYLLSLAVGSFDVVDAGMIPPNRVRPESIPLRGFARRGKGEELALALETAPELVRIFEEALEQPYPYKKLDIVAAPQWPSGATELAAAITYRESRILAGDDIGPAARRGLLAIHAHEVAHMWFGNLVTPPWWDDLWLKEGFASWGEGASLSELYPGEGFELDAIVDGISAMDLDSLATARAVREPIALNRNVRNAYDSITYNKGLAIIGMVDAYFGADTFRPALGRYVEAYEDGVAGSPEFFDIIGEETGEPELTTAFRSFVEQQGLPLVSARLNCPQDGSIRARFDQDRYAPIGSRLHDMQTPEWTIPMCVKIGSADGVQRRCFMLDSGGQEDLIQEGDVTQACPRWIMPNADGVGYFRFSLDFEAWQSLGRAFDEFEAGEKLAILDSAGAEFAAGRLDVQTVWRFIDEAVRDEERRVVQSAIKQARRFERLLSNDDAAMSGYQAAIVDVFQYRLAELEQNRGDDPELEIMRSSLEQFLIMKGQDPALRKSLADAAAAYIGLDEISSDRSISTDEYLTAMATGFQTYGEPFLDRMLAVRVAFDDPVFEQAIAYAIGQNRDSALSARILDLALSKELGTREVLTIVQGQMQQPETQALTWAWLKENLPQFLNSIPRQRKRFSPSLADSMCSLEVRDELLELFERHGDLAPGHERALFQTVERIELCAALENSKGREARAFFSERD